MITDNRKYCIFVSFAILLLTALVIAGCCGILTGSQSNTYTIYIGLNDKDTYTQAISTEEAENTIHTICMQHVDAYTLYHASGYWKDENGIPTKEETLVCVFVGVDQKTVRLIADEVIEALNQNSVLITGERINKEFYSGT